MFVLKYVYFKYVCFKICVFKNMCVFKICVLKIVSFWGSLEGWLKAWLEGWKVDLCVPRLAWSLGVSAAPPAQTHKQTIYKQTNK